MTMPDDYIAAYGPGLYGPTVHSKIPRDDLDANGIINYWEEWGEAHQRRRVDSQAALDAVEAPEPILTVRHGRRRGGEHRLAFVYDTPGGRVIELFQDDSDDEGIRAIRQQMGDRFGDPRGIKYAKAVVTDFLDIPEGIELEVNCRCGPRRLDRAAVRGAADRGDVVLRV